MMKRLVSTLGALFIGLASLPAGAATTVIGTGTYVAGGYPNYPAFPFASPPYEGIWKYELDFSTPVNLDMDVMGDLTSIPYYDFHDGNGFVSVGGDDVPTYYHFDEISPTVYVATVNDITPPTEIYHSASYDFKYEYYLFCCSLALNDFNADAGGDFTEKLISAPEPQAWTLMFLGFGVVGASMRSISRRRARETALPGQLVA